VQFPVITQRICHGAGRRIQFGSYCLLHQTAESIQFIFSGTREFRVSNHGKKNAGDDESPPAFSQWMQ
jgi:hypothetical protein